MRVSRGVGDVVSATGQFPVGSVGDQYQTCVQAGGDAASCAAAVVSANPTLGGQAPLTSGLPAWLLPAALGVFVLALFMGGGRR